MIGWNGVIYGAVLLQFGCTNHWVQVIMQNGTMVRYSVLVNGEPRGYLSPTRGLRQGDPLSPYLFLLFFEGFSALLEVKAVSSALHGIQICVNAPIIHHLLFADDSILYARASSSDCHHI